MIVPNMGRFDSYESDLPLKLFRKKRKIKISYRRLGLKPLISKEDSYF